jgi:predicted metalloprotease with PDZ domain
MATSRFSVPLIVVCTLAGLVISLRAQSPGPQPVPMPPPIVAPRDIAYPGTIRLRVDASDVDHRIFRVNETIPIRVGEPLTLLYPQWLPGNHAPRGRVDQLGGLKVFANGQRVEWTRDVVDVFAFHVRPPAAATTLDVQFDFDSPLDTGQGRVVMGQQVLDLQWNQVVLYPAGYFTRQIRIEPQLRLPAEWRFATALETADDAQGMISFKATTVETLVDSPVFAGRHFKTFELDAKGNAPVRLNLVADRPELLAIPSERIDSYRALVQEADRLFGSRHYGHYDFLLALTDQVGSIGLEHHQSTEIGEATSYFTEWDRHINNRDVTSHEYTHSWNGKFRRPADLWTPNFNVPMRDSLMWVYEGQTEYWGVVLAARAGLLSLQEALDGLAIVAATYDQLRPGREWKSLQDTTNDPITAARRPQPWTSWERSEDYYREGQLVWLDADTLIRERSHGQRSLDDFAKAFFGIQNGSYIPVTYQFDDVVRALNDVVPHDWAAFLRARVEGHGPGAPLDGLKRGGYTLTYSELPTSYYRNVEANGSASDFSYSLGLSITAGGQITSVIWDGPAFKAGLARGIQIVSVNGIAYREERLKTAITDNKSGAHPIELQIRNGDVYRTIALDYRGGLRYPRLERTGSSPALLDEILRARR